jgi:hypothetical protein
MVGWRERVICHGSRFAGYAVFLHAGSPSQSEIRARDEDPTVRAATWSRSAGTTNPPWITAAVLPKVAASGSLGEPHDDVRA